MSSQKEGKQISEIVSTVSGKSKKKGWKVQFKSSESGHVFHITEMKQLLLNNESMITKVIKNQH